MRSEPQVQVDQLGVALGALQGGDPLDPANCVAVRAAGNTEIEDRPSWAFRLGLVARRGPGVCG